MRSKPTRREAILGLTVFAITGSCGLAAARGGDAPPRVLLAFDDDGLAAGARRLLDEKGFAVHAVDLRQRAVVTSEIVAGVVVVACRDIADARRFARSTATAFGSKLLIFSARGWSYAVYAGPGHEWIEKETDEVRAAMVLDVAAREHAARPRPLIRRV